MELQESHNIDDLYKKIHELKQLNLHLEQERKNQQYSSEETKELFTAFSKAQAEFGVVKINRENPFFKSSYADLEAILKAVRLPLSKHNLSFLQQIRLDKDNLPVLHSILAHASGQWIESRMRIIPSKADVQTFGSTLTYNKRYAALSLLGIAVSQDSNDDDGEKDMVQERYTINKQKDEYEKGYEPITKEQLDILENEFEDHPDLASRFLKGYNLKSLADMPKTKYLDALKQIREVKRKLETAKD